MLGCVLLAGLLTSGWNLGASPTFQGLFEQGDGQYLLTTANVGSYVIGQQELEDLVKSLSNVVNRKEPAYATWGGLAIEKTKSQYNADVIDYLYMGRTTISSVLAEEKFKLWVRKGSHEFGVYVTVTYHPVKKQFLSIRFEEF